MDLPLGTSNVKAATTFDFLKTRKLYKKGVCAKSSNPLCLFPIHQTSGESAAHETSKPLCILAKNEKKKEP